MKKLAMLSLLVVLSPAHLALADSGHSDGCHRVRAEIIDAPTTEGCTSPNAFCAAGTVRGNLGLNGTTYFTLDGAVRGPASAPGFLATSGILVYTTSHGTLTVRETGVSQSSSGLISAVQQVVSGTGRFAGATGHLYVASETIDGQFVADVTGELCLDR